MKKSQTIKVNEIPVRDYLILKLKLGATKSGVQTDRKKEESKRKARRKVIRNDPED